MGNMCTKFQVNWTSTSLDFNFIKNYIDQKLKPEANGHTDGRMDGGTDQKT